MFRCPLIVAVSILVCLAATASSFDVEEHLEYFWERFKTHHGKKYDEKEERVRRSTFAKHLHVIIEHNLEAEFGDHSYTLGLNEYADWSSDEFKTHLRGYRKADRDKKTSVKKPTGTTLLTSTADSLPDSVNWVNEGWVTSVKNQGRCGCCYTFAAAGALEGQLYNQTQYLTSLSEQNLLDCSTAQGNMGCNGGVIDWAFEYVQQNGGIDTDEAYPYTGKQGTCSYQASNSVATCSGWYNVDSGNELALQQAVATVGPVAVAIDASQMSFQLYRSGVYSSSSCSSTNLDHAVLTVGYGTASNGQQYWLVKNSWGTSWGMNGYIEMARNQNNMCGIATEPSYPTM